MRHLLYRNHWRFDGDTFVRLPGANVVASFATAEAADAVYRQREAEARAAVGNPFRAAGPAVRSQTTMPEPVYRDWLREYDLEPPESDWPAWWDQFQSRWTDGQRAAVWEPLDRLRFYSLAVGRVGYAVVESGWEYNDKGYDQEPEGGQVLAVYRTRERAEAELAGRVSARQRADATCEWACYDCESRMRADDPFGPIRTGGYDKTPAEARFFEVIEVPLEGDDL